jgi:tetratricopeptide (TPR) repeat protein
MTMSQNSIQEALNQGHTAAWDQKWEEAAGHYRRALELAPQDSKALISMGLAMFELGRYEESLNYYRQASESNPDDPLPFEKIAQIAELIENVVEVPRPSLRAAELYLNLGEVERAIENLARVTRVDAGNLSAHSRLAVIYERQGRKKQAVTEYLTIASLFQQKGQADNAVKAIQRALTIDPNSKEAKRTLELISQGISLPQPVRAKLDRNRFREQVPGNAGEAKSVRQKSKAADPIQEALQRSLEVLAGLVFESIENNQEDLQEPTKGFQAILRGTQKSLFTKKTGKDKMRTHLGRAIDYQSQGFEDKAADELELAVESGLDHAAVYYDLGFIRSEGGRLESAIRYLNKAADSDEYSLGAHLLLGVNYRKMGREDEAALEYLRALRYADGQVVPPEMREEIYQLYEPLIEAVSRQTEPESNARVCDTVADLLQRSDWRERLEQARRDFQIEVKDGPVIPLGEVISQASGSRIIASILSIHKLARQGYMRSAMEEAYFALQHAPTYLPLHTYMGELLLQQDKIPEAITKFITIAQTYSARGEADRAIQILKRVTRTAPMNLNGRIRLIEILESLGRREEAVQEYLDLAEVYYNLADLDHARGAYIKALDLARSDGKNRDLIITILHSLADISLQSLDWRNALKNYDQIRSIDPGDTRARENLVEVNLRLAQHARAQEELEDYLLYLRSTRQIQKATEFLERLSSEYPEQPFLRWNLIENYKALGRKADAIRHLDAMGEQAVESGDRPAAIQIIEEILELDPPNRDDYQALLNQIRGESSPS